MNRTNRTRREFSLGTELLESRALLNAHLPRAPIAHVESIHAAATAPMLITGILTGTSPYHQQTKTPLVGTDGYTASGGSSVGTASVTGSDQVSSKLINKKTYADTYYSGNWTLKLGDGATVSITYGGTGHSLVSNASYTARFSGQAYVTSGPGAGAIHPFRASISGNDSTDAVTIKFTLK